jgi:putative tricarboxylic transport membrane protein
MPRLAGARSTALKLSDAVLGGLAVLLGAAVFVNTLSFPAMADGAPGPALFPQILSTLLVLFGLVNIYQSTRPHDVEEIHYSPANTLKAFGVLVAIAFYVVAVHALGFLITVTLIMFCLMTMLKVRVRVGAPTALLLAIACIGLFEKILRVPLPPGVLGG